MAARAHVRFEKPEIRCIGCGCTEVSACQDNSALSPNGACFWVFVEEETGHGFCSRCAATPIDELIDRMRLLPPETRVLP